MLGFGRRTPDKNMQIGAAHRSAVPSGAQHRRGPPPKNSHIKIRGER